VLGAPDDYDREVSITYPALVEDAPCPENGWISTPRPTFDIRQLRDVLQNSMGYRGETLENAMGRYVLYPHRDVTLSGEAHHMPDLGAVKVSTRTIEIEV